MIERESELAVIHDVVTGSPGIGTRLLVIEGPAGCGKSELVDSAAVMAKQSGARFLLAAGGTRCGERPLETIRQLFGSPHLPARARARLAGTVDGEDTRFEVMQEGCAVLREVSESARLVLGVDDLHLADARSIRYLLHLARHTRDCDIAIVVTLAMRTEPAFRSLGMELLRLANSRRLRVNPLGPGEVRRLLDKWLGRAGSADAAVGLHRMTGGNLLLLRAVLEDCRAARPSDPERWLGHPVPGTHFVQALAMCLRQVGPDAQLVADALAVLGEHSEPALVRRLLGLTETATTLSLGALSASGITDADQFRHPDVRTVALDLMAAGRRTELHQRAAAALYDSSVAASDVAPHLLAAGRVTEPWGIAVLRCAADQMLDTDTRLAIRYLELAVGSCVDDVTRAELLTRLAGVGWRLDPDAAERHLSEPLAMARSGRLPAATVVSLAKLLSAHGRIEDVQAVMPTTTFPGTPYFQSLIAPWAVPELTTSADIVDAAEQLLRSTPLTDATLTSLFPAINALGFGNRPDLAARWATAMVERSRRRQAPGWQAAFTSLLADMHWLQETWPTPRCTQLVRSN